MLFAVTSSLYFKLDGFDEKVRLEVLTHDGRLMPPISLDRDVRGDGQPFFPRFTKQMVTVVVKEPRGWHLREPQSPFAFYPWSRREIVFPRDFAKKEFHVIRVVP